MKKELSVIIIFSLLVTLGLVAVAKRSITTHKVLPKDQSAIDTSVTTPLPLESTTKPPMLNPLTPVTTAEQVFSLMDETTSSAPVIDLMVTGDVLLARHVNVLMQQKKDFTWPFQDVAGLLRAADITFINLETPLTKDCKPRSDGMIFCGDSRATTGLQYAGVDVVNVANNHASNQGIEGVSETITALQEAKIAVAGPVDNNATYLTVSGVKFGFLGFNEVNDQPGVTTAYSQTVKDEIIEARSQADVVIVQFHWGNEYTYTPSSHQRELARLAIDSGADLVVGNHPHWFQPFEFYKDTMIMYSHGNLIFDQMWSKETRIGLIGHYQFSNKKLVGVTFIPTRIEEYGQPHILEGAQRDEVLQTLQTESRKLASP